MIGDAVVVDAVVHPYNLAPQNQDRTAQAQLDAVYAAHRMAADPEHQAYLLQPAEFFSDVSFDVIAQAAFVESPVDLAVIHSLPNLGFTLGNVTDPDRAAACRDAHPRRCKLYATVDTPVLRTAVAQLERQVKELGVDGLKVYPAFFYDGTARGWRLDGEDFATPLLEAARKLGIRNVAIHKALWLAPAPRDAFNIDDMGSPLERFPDLNFQIVHAGTAFLDETRRLLERHRNLYLTLETMFAYILVKPRLFAKILATFLKSCGSDRLLFASGCNLMHPGPILKAFAKYELPEEVMREVGSRQLTEADRRNILGLNALRLYGLRPEDVVKATREDAFAKARAQRIPPPWSVLRAGAMAA
jgi:hypothetical protein